MHFSPANNFGVHLSSIKTVHQQPVLLTISCLFLAMTTLKKLVFSFEFLPKKPHSTTCTFNFPVSLALLYSWACRLAKNQLAIIMPITYMT